MSRRRVDVFYYGSYMNDKVLAEAGMADRPRLVASLQDYALHIGPMANLVPAAGRTAFGLVIPCDHDELERLYGQEAMKLLGSRYLPEAILVRDTAGRYLPVLTYISHDLEPGPADPAYMDRILEPARTHGFPGWFLEHIASFR